MSGPKIALLGFSIECNRFAPPATEADFRGRCWVEGAALLADARAAVPAALGEMPGFVREMDAAGPWRPLPSLLAMAEPNGPVEQSVFDAMMATWRRDLEAARRDGVDGVYCVLHGAGLTTELDDPEGAVQALVREILGTGVPLVCGHDLHANVSDAMVRDCDGFVGYRTNPHVDMRARGAEAAQLLRRILGGTRTHLALRRLPIVPPTVSMLTAQGPYAELIDLGQAMQARDPRILNVSVMGGFA
ncbi:MAG: M81 family metallopeptidase, partial [Acetobacteraceae bacterium]|nr:M81 family metallopeptidase [Acetobacteraceae bacterium]